MYIPIVLLASVMSLIVRLIIRKNRQARALAGPEDPRWQGSQGEQIAGRVCAECSVKIMMATEATACPACREPLHKKKCKKRHKAMAHRPEGVGPYR